MTAAPAIRSAFGSLRVRQSASFNGGNAEDLRVTLGSNSFAHFSAENFES